MSFYDSASRNSYWRGVYYYESDYVTSLRQIDNETWASKVQGNNNNVYNVEININHPRKSKCTCPFADGRRVVCKHMVATYFKVFPDEAKEVIRERDEYEQEQEMYEDEIYDKVTEYVDSLSEDEVRASLMEYLIRDMERGDLWL